MKKDDKDFQNFSWLQCLEYLLTRNVSGYEEDLLISKLKEEVAAFFLFLALFSSLISFIFLLFRWKEAVLIGAAVDFVSLYLVFLFSDFGKGKGGCGGLC